MFERDFARLGIKKGDVVLMHSSMKSLGTTLTPTEFLRELIDFLGEEGTLLLPALSYESISAKNPHFIANETPSCVGILPQTFRQMPGVLRSVHPTHSVCAFGKLAREMTKDHSLDETPVGSHSPLRKLVEVGGKILMVGVRESLTFMHGMEEIAGAPYCLEKQRTHYILTDMDGGTVEKDMFAHDFADIAEQRYERAEDLLAAPELMRGTIGKSDCLLYDAKALARVALDKMAENPYYFVDRAE